jgi:hypothetical protein
VLLIDGVHKLVDVVIANPTQDDLVSWAIISHRVITIVVIQANDGLYQDRFLVDMFLLLIVEVFKCLH